MYPHGGGGIYPKYTPMYPRLAMDAGGQPWRLFGPLQSEDPETFGRYWTGADVCLVPAVGFENKGVARRTGHLYPRLYPPEYAK